MNRIENNNKADADEYDYDINDEYNKDDVLEKNEVTNVDRIDNKKQEEGGGEEEICEEEEMKMMIMKIIQMILKNKNFIYYKCFYCFFSFTTR